jgi:hypothetical protein
MPMRAAGGMSPSHRNAARVLWLGAVLGSLCAQAQTSGQTSMLVDSALAENNGIRFGPGRLHPYIDLEFRYDSAALYMPAGGVAGAPQELKGELLLHTRPGFRLDVPGTDITFGLNGFYDYVWYTGIITSGSSNASRSEAGADMHAEFYREGAVEFDVGDIFGRSDRPLDIGLGIATISLHNQLRLALPIHPGGHALEVKPHGEYAVEFFSQYSGVPPGLGPCTGGPEVCAPDPSIYDYQNYSGGLDARWKFLPQTAVLFESSYEGRKYFHPAPGFIPPGSLLKLRTGLAGLLTTKIAIILKVGWAQGFSGAASTFIGQGEATWNINETSTLAVGILRDVGTAVGAASYTDLRPYVNARTFLSGRLGLHANFSYDLVSFTQGRGGKDQLFSVDLGPEYEVTRWFILAAGYVLSTRSSDVLSTSLPLNYTRNEAYLRFTFTY